MELPELVKYPEPKAPANPAPVDRKRRAAEFAKLSKRDQATLVAKAVDAVKTEFKLGNQSIAQITTRYNDNDPSVRNAMASFADIEFKDVTARDLGLTYAERQSLARDVYAAENAAIAAKIHAVPSSENLDRIIAFLKGKGIPVDALSHKKLRQLLLLDDWSSIFKTALPLIVQHGPALINKLWEHYLPRIRDLAGMDAGLWEGDTPSFTGVPSRMSLWPGVSKDLATAPITSLNTATMSHYPTEVNADYIASVICPERYCERRYDPAPQRTSLVSGSIQYTLTTDSSGNCQALLFVDNPFGSGSSLQNSYVVHSPSGYNPTTGALTAWTYGLGPLATLSSQLIKSRPSSVSCTFTPTLSQNNNQGNVATAMFIDDTQPTNVLGYSQAQILQNPFMSTGNM